MSVMEMSLFQSNSMSTSEMAQVGRMYSNLFSSIRYLPAGVKVCPQFCSCLGNPLKASFSSHPSSSNNRYLSTNAIVSIAGDKLAAETSLFQIFGTNGARSNLFPRDIRVLDAFDDEYGGVIVDPERLPENADAFAYILNSSLSHWRLQRKKGIWLKLPVERAELVPVAIKEGFQYHHAEQGYVMLTYWIPEGPCMIPANASHQVGVGGFVVNNNNEVLVVQEKHCDPACVGFWKIPTGFILESEEIFTGTVREVKEETGIDTEFVEVIAFRHAHNVAFEKSDLFFICMLKPVSTQIIVDDLEIEAAKWMPLAEFVEQPLVKEDSMFKKVISICIARLGKRYCGLSSHQVVSKFDGRLSSSYYNVVDTQDFNCSDC
ncbi:nudix hydrolase 8 [Argentina anserina]|uniref:nudix hydrolase 8 n=1 Tax=Argentina anserina TaxID=57926 RepID=UPI0021763EAB|nr:nudix hydrolase 8 [Potentilla anserina]